MLTQHVRRGATPGAIQRKLSDDEMDHCEPFRIPGEDQRPARAASSRDRG
jgi:hypothetical protein